MVLRLVVRKGKEAAAPTSSENPMPLIALTAARVGGNPSGDLSIESTIDCLV